MIWAIVSSQFCFCWLYRVSPFLAAKTIINLISLLAIWLCPCVESPLALLEEGVCYDQWIRLAKFLAFALLHSYSKSQFACYSRRCWLPTFLFQAPTMKRTSFWVLVLNGLVGLHRTVQFQLLQHYRLGHRLGLPWYWMGVCLGNEQRSFCHFWDCIQVQHFGLFCWLWWLLHLF